jgi:tetratricopeptide (TPR) repeat protein
MNLTDNRLKELENPSLTHNERVLLRCRLASEFIHTGQYENAREALGEFWQGVGRRPEVERLKPPTAAEVLLQCGTLSGWLGGAQHISGAQEKAKDLLFESLRMFKTQNQSAKVSEAKYELSKCYFRLGAYDDARVFLEQAIKGLGEQNNDLKAKIFIRQSVFEIWTSRYRDALDVLEKAREFFEASSDALKGKWHSQMAIILMQLAATEKRVDYADRAIIEYTAAIFHLEQAGHERYCGSNLNNLAFLFYKLGRYSEAHERLDRAQEIFERHKDTGSLAQVNETRARAFVAERNYHEANRLIADVIQTFEKGGEFGRLTDALTIQGIARARLGLHESSLQILRHAMSMAQNSGAYSNAGLAALTLLEEHGEERLSITELFDIYNRADELLKDTQDSEEIARLRACARIMSRRIIGVRLSDKDFVLPEAVHAYEARFIREALEAENGMVTRAAKRLGVGHQTLVNALNTRHQELLSLRTPPKSRRKTVIRHDYPGKKRKSKYER